MEIVNLLYYSLQGKTDYGFLNTALAFFYLVAHQFGLWIVRAIQFVIPGARFSESLINSMGFLAIITIFMIIASVARKVAWILVIIAWALVLLKVILLIIGK